MQHLTLITLLASAALSSAARLTVSVSPSQLLPNPSTLPPSTHAVLLGPPGIRYDVPLRGDNTFLFPDLADASYLLTLHSQDYFFPPLRVDVSKQEGQVAQTVHAWQTFRGNEWSNKGMQYGSGQDTLAITVAPIGPKQYYQPRGGFNLIGFFKSPMILLALVSVVFIFGLPYLMENMDAETKAEFEEMQKSGSLLPTPQGAAGQLQNFDLASWMAGRSAAGGNSSPGGGDTGKKR